MIRYENGTKDIFDNKSNEAAIAPVLSSDELFRQGRSDASRYYHGYKGAGTGTLITSLVSPLLGLIPAIATSSANPSNARLNYPNADLMKKSSYYDGYTQKAKSIKRGKVWKNWGIGLGVNIIAAAILLSSQ